MEKAVDFAKLWQRLLILAVLASISYFSLWLENPAVIVFFVILAALMFINFWFSLKKEKETYFFIGLMAMCVLMILAILTFIGWVIGIPMFNGFWADIFAWPSLVGAMIVAGYAMFLLDDSMRSEAKNWVKTILKKYTHQIVFAIVLIAITTLSIISCDRITQTYESFKACMP